MIHINNDDEIHVEINTGTFAFSSNAMATGNQPSFPIFNSKTFLNNKQVDIMEYGLPFLKFNRDEIQHFKFTNHTPYYFNLHFHGFNNNAFIDGTSYTAEFGENTKIGKTLEFSVQTKNNSMFSWFHPHVGMLSSPLVYSGLFGIYEVSDIFSKKIEKNFNYGDNSIILVYSDADLNITGTLNNRRLNDNNWRGFYGAINGQLCLNWTLGHLMPFYTKTLSHTSTKNLFKISLLNGTASFRSVYLGVCDKHKNIRPFYYIQSDCGFRNPVEMTILSISPAERATILFDLNDFEDQEATIFFYNFDLTYIFSQLNNVYLNSEKQVVTMFGEKYNCGTQFVPGVQYLSNTFDKKPFLHIKYVNQNHDSQNNKSDSLKRCIEKIKKIVFGYNYNLISKMSDEKISTNYFSLLNSFYYYNLPNVQNCSTRQMVFNMMSYPDKNVTEWINMAPRVYVDMWNSYEYEQWKLTKSDAFLPSCLFFIKPPSEYENYKDFSTNTLTITISENFLNLQTLIIQFPTSEKPLNIKQWVNIVNTSYKATQLDLPNKKYNYLSDILELEWSDYLLEQYYLWNNSETYKKSIFIKTILMKNINKSEYTIEFLGNYKLLNFFGKTLGATLPGKNMLMVEQLPLKNYGILGNVSIFFGMWGQMIFYMLIGMILGMHIGMQIGMLFGVMKPIIMKIGMYVGMYSFMAVEMGFTKITIAFFITILVQIYILFILYFKKKNLLYIVVPIIFTIIIYFMIHIFPLYTRNNSTLKQIQVTQGSKNGLNVLYTPTLVISPFGSYKGLVDGYMNDLFMNFSVKKNATEQWLFTNLDTNNVHPLHFHLTSGYVDPTSKYMSDCLKAPDFQNLLYSKDTYAIGIQQTLPFYLKFSNYSSSEGKVKNLGYFYHCHFMLHHDMNMMGQYFVTE